MEKLGRVAADGVYDLSDVVERNASWTAAVVDACGEFMFKNVLHGTAKVRARKRVAVLVRKQGRRATGAEPVRNPVDGAGASSGRVVHRERHAKNHCVWHDGGNRVFGLGLVLAVIVDGIFGISFDVRTVRLCLFVAAKDHVGGNADESRVVAGCERGCVNALAEIQETAAGGVAFAGLERAVSACVDDSAKVELFKKFAQTFRFFGIHAENVVAKNARVLYGANPDDIVAIQFVEVPEKCIAGNAVQPENQYRKAHGAHL